MKGKGCAKRKKSAPLVFESPNKTQARKASVRTPLRQPGITKLTGCFTPIQMLRLSYLHRDLQSQQLSACFFDPRLSRPSTIAVPEFLETIIQTNATVSSYSFRKGPGTHTQAHYLGWCRSPCLPHKVDDNAVEGYPNCRRQLVQHS